VAHKVYSIILLAGNVLLYTAFLFAMNSTIIYALNEDLSSNSFWVSSEQYSPDIYENDNRHGYKSAQIIVVGDEPQQHNFHKAGDVDWVKFYGLANTLYRIEVVNPREDIPIGSKCDAVIELYDSDGTKRLDRKDDFREGERECLEFRPSKDGIYYVKLSNYSPDIYGADTEYGLKVFIPTAPGFPGILTGIVSDSVTKAPIRNAEVKTDNMGSSLSNAKGSYTLIEEQGNWMLTVNALGYHPFSQNVLIIPGPQTFNVEMTPIGSVNEPEEGLSQIIDYGIALNGITYSTNVFAATGDFGALATSTDGKSWTDRSFSTDNELYGIAYGNNTYVSVGDYGTILYSTDGTLWTKATSNTRNHLYGITYGDGLFIAVGEKGTILSSPDGNIWTDRSFNTNKTLYSTAYGAGLFIAVGDRGKILSSPDGNIWTDRSFDTNNALYGVTYGNGIFVAVGEYGMILTSSDGALWTDRSVNPSYELNAIIYGNGTFIASGDGGKLLSSKDGVTWKERKSNTEVGHYGIAYGNGSFVAVGDHEIIFLPDSTPYTLTVSKSGTGTGTVTSSPSGIDCGPDCSESYNQGTNVTLTATPASGSIFGGWSGGGCSGTGSCSITMNSNQTITATFNQQPQHTLIVTKSGTGTGTVTSSPAGINCGDDCSESYPKVQKVKLTAKADASSTFAGWSGGGCSGTKTCTVTVDAPVTVTADFALKIPDISVAQTPIDFGNIKVGKKGTKTLKIGNNGTGDLSITLSGLGGTDFSIQGSSSVTIKPKKSYTLKVLFMPESAGLETAILEIGSNDPDTPTLDISLSGTGQ
jgi:hypothetical protein